MASEALSLSLSEDVVYGAQRPEEEMDSFIGHDSNLESAEGAAEGTHEDGQRTRAEDEHGVKDESSKTGSKGQYFVFTQNLVYEEEEALGLIERFKIGLEQCLKLRQITFISVGHEIAPKTGMHHLQGYIEIQGRMTFKQFKNMQIFSGQKPVWVAQARGNGMENIEYTGKAKDEGRYYYISGEFRNYGQGKSKDMVLVQKKLDQGVVLSDIYRNHFETSAKHYRFFKEYISVTTPSRDSPTQVYYIYGPSGTGKSKYCADTWGFNRELVYWLPLQKAGGNVWWDGYEGQKTVIIDDWYPGYFGKGHCTFMQRLVDRYPFMVAIHCGQVNFAATTIVFSSNTPIDEIDDIKYSGHPWDSTNPLYHRVYLREPKWIIKFLDHAAPPPSPPQFIVTTLKQSDASQLAAKRLMAARDRRAQEMLKFNLMDEN